MDDELRSRIESVAAIAIGSAQMGETKDTVMSHVVGAMGQVGLLSAGFLPLIAEAIRMFPQPEDEDAEEREQRRPIEDWLGVDSPEAQLSAQMLALEAVLDLASRA